ARARGAEPARPAAPGLRADTRGPLSPGRSGHAPGLGEVRAELLAASRIPLERPRGRGPDAGPRTVLARLPAPSELRPGGRRRDPHVHREDRRLPRRPAPVHGVQQPRRLAEPRPLALLPGVPDPAGPRALSQPGA